MSKIDYQALREAAEKATPGNWWIDSHGQAMVSFIDNEVLEVFATDNKLDAVRHEDTGNLSRWRNDNDATFIAKANPATVLALLDELEAAEKRITELEGGAFNPAILDVVAERQRQKTIEGWTPEHDDEHCNGELAMAAVCYINETGTVNRNGGKPWGWPWDASWWKPKTRRRNLVKAGALILAEIERLDRDAGIGVKGE